MNFAKTFLDLTQYTIPFGHESELEPLLPKDYKKDSIGNYYYEIGNSKTLFTAHLDTATDAREKINHIIDGTIIKTDGTTILGGDNKAGCCILFYMISKKVPGTYFFFLGEESAVHQNLPHGSLLAIEKNPEYFKKFKRVISFDRKEMGQMITRQLGYNCCSSEFAKSLISEFSKHNIDYKEDRTGYYTDSAFFGNLISEITNLSAGVWNEHTTNEYVNIKYVEAVAMAAAKVKWELLPTVREVDNFQTDPRTDDIPKGARTTKDAKLFQAAFSILDELYFICREIRNYQNYLSHFKSSRDYHFTKWHDSDDGLDDNWILSVKDGVITANGKNFKNIEDFKRSLGIERLNRMRFLKLMSNEFDKNGGKLSDARFHFLLYQKGGHIERFEKDVRKSGWLLTRIGKGYELIKETYSMKYLKVFENFTN